MYIVDGFSSIGVKGGAAPANPADMDADPAALLRLGNKQVPKASDFNGADELLQEADLGQKNFILLSMICFSCDLMSTWEAIIV